MNTKSLQILQILQGREVEERDFSSLHYAPDMLESTREKDNFGLQTKISSFGND